MRRLLGPLLAMALAGTAAAQSATQATTLPPPPPPEAAATERPQTGVLRGSPGKPVLQSATGAAAQGAPASRRRVADPALASPSLISPAAPRLDRALERISGGGGQCRTKCAQELYFCGGSEGGGSCDENWRKCVIACPSQSGSPP